VSVIASYLIYGGFPVGSIGFISVLTIGALPLAVFVAWPMLKFKSQLRTLVVDDTGIATVIGNKSATLFWSDVADVREAGGAIVIQNRNLNAFIVPSRAFRTSQEKQEFRNFIFSKLQSEPPTGSNKFD
jgi:hypothetical protein